GWLVLCQGRGSPLRWLTRTVGNQGGCVLAGSEIAHAAPARYARPLFSSRTTSFPGRPLAVLTHGSGFSSSVPWCRASVPIDRKGQQPAMGPSEACCALELRDLGRGDRSSQRRKPKCPGGRTDAHNGSRFANVCHCVRIAHSAG